jgi:hypothetical protein
MILGLLLNGGALDQLLRRSRPVEDFRLIYGSLGKILSIIQPTAVAMTRWFNLLRCFSLVPQRYRTIP